MHYALYLVPASNFEFEMSIIASSHRGIEVECVLLYLRLLLLLGPEFDS